jgi:hypothetical protein
MKTPYVFSPVFLNFKFDKMVLITACKSFTLSLIYNSRPKVLFKLKILGNDADFL